MMFLPADERNPTMSAVPERIDESEEVPVERDLEDETAPSVDLPPVADPADAEWRLRRLKRQIRARAEVQATYERLTAETKEWYDGEVGSLDAEIEETERQLAGWLAARIEADPKGPKNVSLPSAKISSSAVPVSLEVEDEAAFMVWARQHMPSLINPGAPKPPVPKPDANAVKALGTATHKYPKPGDYPIEVEISGEHEDPLAEGEPPRVKVEIPGVKIVRKPPTVKVEWPEAL